MEDDRVNVKLVEFLSRQRVTAKELRKFGNLLVMAADLKQQAEEEIKPPPTPSGHSADCDWHCEQVPQDCTCHLSQ